MPAHVFSLCSEYIIMLSKLVLFTYMYTMFCTYIQTIIFLCLANLFYTYIYIHTACFCTYIFTISCILQNAHVFSLCSQYVIMLSKLVLFTYQHNILLCSLIMPASLFCTCIPPTIILLCLASLFCVCI